MPGGCLARKGALTNSNDPFQRAKFVNGPNLLVPRRSIRPEVLGNAHEEPAALHPLPKAMPEAHCEQDKRRAAPLPKAPIGLKGKSLLPRPIKRFDSADYFLQQHMEKQRAELHQPHMPVEPTVEEYTDCSSCCSSRPASSESERTGYEDVPMPPPAPTRQLHSSSLHRGTGLTGFTNANSSG